MTIRLLLAAAVLATASTVVSAQPPTAEQIRACQRDFCRNLRGCTSGDRLMQRNTTTTGGVVTKQKADAVQDTSSSYPSCRASAEESFLFCSNPPQLRGSATPTSQPTGNATTTTATRPRAVTKKTTR